MNKLNIHLRNAVRKDFDKILDLIGMHARAEHAEFRAEEKKEKLGNAIFKNPPSLFCLIAECDHIVIGFASYYFTFSTWEAAPSLMLDCIYVEENYRSLGIGNALMELLQQIGRSNDCTTIKWLTLDSNAKAIKFYERIGATGKTDKIRYSLSLSHETP
ncbi:GNAT family N-acetyltransferase [Mucilaginibacter conchicola]|uniref:GNAT family N-acetyltransferase n=1 Tax=Mucilaginibacter conchicola TaxID=2303333 RepID=A0A372NNU1_9SPHI|nr:GNAT family N-acetyltransferase [Mucilaginibacter conchicola]RFZ90277.1 GNAT family N-acetyltransferase [Mucilaginibacter conchicola]